MPVRVKQHDITDCGAACIASIASHYKLDLPVSRIRQLATTDKQGTNVLGLLQALEKLGFEAKGVRGGMDSLEKIPTPAIAHVIIGQALHHYVVIYRATPNFIEVMDPADGKMHRHPPEEFRKCWTGVLVILLPGEIFQPCKLRVSTRARFWELMRPHSKDMVQALAGAMVYTLIGLTPSIYVQKIVDYVLVDENRNLLNLMTAGMVVLLVLQIFIGSMKSIYTLRTGQSIDARLILGYYKHLLKLPQRFFDTMRIGEVISRVNDAVKIRSFINETLTHMTADFFILVFSFAFMFMYYWKLALVAILIVPCYVLIYIIVDGMNRKVERTLMENAAELESQLVESLNSVTTIKNLGLESYANAKTETRFVNLLKSVYSSGLNFIFSGSSAEFCSRLFTILLLWVGAGFVLDSEITPGELLSFYALAGYFTAPVNSLIGSNKALQSARIASDRLFEIMDLELDQQENQITLAPEMVGDIRFSKVTYSYGSRTAVFENVSLTIPQRKVTAIVGESGSGKTTIIAILQKLYPVHRGHVYIGDIDLRYITNDSLHAIIAVVPQTIDLFAGNVAENIAAGYDRPEMKKIISICSALGILEFIEKLPQGFNTHLGENGTTLSGGQKQRIAIARALYREPQILILDEATASLDSDSEKQVRSVVDLLRQQNKTVIIISHRLSTVFQADKIMVLDHGKIVEEGSHDELLRNQGAYFRLWKLQYAI